MCLSKIDTVKCFLQEIVFRGYRFFRKLRKFSYSLNVTAIQRVGVSKNLLPQLYLRIKVDSTNFDNIFIDFVLSSIKKASFLNSPKISRKFFFSNVLKKCLKIFISKSVFSYFFQHTINSFKKKRKCCIAINI